MVSTIVHVSVGVIISCALLPSDKISLKSIGIVGLSVALLDFDAFLFSSTELHRAVLHNVIFPSFIISIIAFDILYRDNSYIGKFFETDWVIVISFVSYISVIFAGIGLDYSDSGVNLLWPIHDQFYTLDGKFIYSSEKGIVQTFFESPETVTSDNPKDTTETVDFKTPVDPPKESSTERVFPIAKSGWQLVIIGTSVITVFSRIGVEYFNSKISSLTSK